jgi:hypothetical protein
MATDMYRQARPGSHTSGTYTGEDPSNQNETIYGDQQCKLATYARHAATFDLWQRSRNVSLSWHCKLK